MDANSGSEGAGNGCRVSSHEDKRLSIDTGLSIDIDCAVRGAPPLGRERSMRRDRSEAVSGDQTDSGDWEGGRSGGSSLGVPLRGRTGSSCHALRHAVLKLYRLDDFSMTKIGEGFFSEVYKVVHNTNEEVMVLKMNVNESNRPNMLREAQLMNKMSHPNILKFLGVCVHQGQLHALTEYINGGDLHGILTDNKDPLPWRERISLSKDIAKGVQYLHHTGYIHRDLTSRNVLVRLEPETGRKTAVVSDFGLVAKIPDASLAEFHLSVAGSPYWMSPECITGNRYFEKADIFSFGIMQCEIIGRIDADPTELPRTSNFGLDYVAFSKTVEDCPLHYLHLAFRCCQIDPDRRPPFTEVISTLTTILSRRLTDEEPDEREEPTEVAVTPRSGPASVARAQFAFSPRGSHKRSRSAGDHHWLLEPTDTTPSSVLSRLASTDELDSSVGAAPRVVTSSYSTDVLLLGGTSSPSTLSTRPPPSYHPPAHVLGLRMSYADQAFYLPPSDEPADTTKREQSTSEQFSAEKSRLVNLRNSGCQNPFSGSARFRDGRKLLASSAETAHYYSQLRHWQKQKQHQQHHHYRMGGHHFHHRGGESTAHYPDLSGMSSPTSHLVVDPFSASSTPLQSPRLTFSLPDSPGLVQQAICQLNARIFAANEASRQKEGTNNTSLHSKYILLGSTGSTSSSVLDETFDDNSSVDSAVVLERSHGRKTHSSNSGIFGEGTFGSTHPGASYRSARARRRSYSTNQRKQLSVECAMLFSCLELIQVQRQGADDLSTLERQAARQRLERSGGVAEAAQWARTCQQESSNLELQLQDDLEDVLRSGSSSESYISTDNLISPGSKTGSFATSSIAMSSMATSSMTTDSMATESMATVSAATSIIVSSHEDEFKGVKEEESGGGRFISRTLVETRRSLRRVEPRNKEKMEELEKKWDTLKIIDQRLTKERKLSTRFISCSPSVDA